MAWPFSPISILFQRYINFYDDRSNPGKEEATLGKQEQPSEGVPSPPPDSSRLVVPTLNTSGPGEGFNCLALDRSIEINDERDHLNISIFLLIICSRAYRRGGGGGTLVPLLLLRHVPRFTVETRLSVHL